MSAAFHTHDPLPLWANVLMASEEWGCPPWEIAGGSQLQWFWRWIAYAERRNKAMKEAANG